MPADQAPAEGAEAPKKKSKKLPILILGVVLAGGGGGAAWYFMKPKALQGEGAEAAAAAAPKKEEKKPIFVPLDPFTVNLQDGRGERYAQIGLTLQLDDPIAENAVKDKLPAVRNGILLLISSKTIDELLTPEGKQKLALQVGVRAAQAIGVDITDADVLPAPRAPAVAASAVVPAVHPAAQSEAAPAAPAVAAQGASAPEVPPAAQPAPSAGKVRKVPENPVRSVLFSQFIVQ